MQYVLIGFFTLLAFLFFYKIVMPSYEPDFSLRGQVSFDKLKKEIDELAVRSRKITKKGKGLSIKLTKQYIDKSYKTISKKLAKGLTVFEFENWLYDNHYKLTQRLDEIKKEVHKFWFLPHVNDLPRVYSLTQLIVKLSDGYVNDTILRDCVSEFNLETPLNFLEIMAIKPALSFALLEFVAIFCAKSIKINSNIFKAERDAKKQKVDIARLNYNSYVYGFYTYSPDKAKRAITQLCLDNGVDLNSRLDNFYSMTARYATQVRSAISSIHATDNYYDDEFLLELSPVHELLLSIPNLCYKEVTKATKLMYLMEISHIAKRKKISELALARQKAEQSFNENCDISKLILPKEKGKKFARFFVAINIALLLILATIFSFVFKEKTIAIMLVSTPILFALCGMFFEFVLKNATRRRVLPSYDLKFCDDKEVKSLITVSRLIATEAETEEAFKNLTVTLHANSNSIFSYCLLVDLPTSRSESYSENDKKIIEKLKELYESSSYKDRLLILLRKRKKTQDGTIYQGWEKKRGAILQLNDLIINDEREDFELILGKQTSGFRYVIALDCDTQTNSCLRLVELMQHPYNSDKAIITMRMNTSAIEANKTLFSKIFSGGTGLDSYFNYAVDAEHDLFGGGNYTGKGIYQVNRFQGRLREAFMDERILSHDYIEGAVASCANSNEVGLDSFPLSFSQFLTRAIRWTRGDWQLLPYLAPKIKRRDGSKIKNPISPISKFRILANLINSLIPISAIGLIIISLFVARPLMVWGLAFLIPIVYLLRSIRASALNLNSSFLFELIRQVFYCITLPVLAFNSLAAIALTIHRLITGKKLLEWKTFAHSSSSKISFVPSYICAIVLCATTIIYSLSPVFYVLSGMFVLGALFDRVLSNPIKTKPYKSEWLDTILKETILKTYGFFMAQHNKENNYLPCDNYQEDAGVGWVYRTSPTNIGFALISHVCAYEAGLITKYELNGRVRETIKTIEALPKWEGNLFNWIDVKTLEPLFPRYVSTVDSGNLLACLSLLSVYVDKPLKERIDKLILDTKIESLFDEKRGLFRIGYNDSEGFFDQNHYDIVASEASLTYLIATAYGKIGRSGWNNLSRNAIKYKGLNVFGAWTSGMFEHLTRSLFFLQEKGTVYQRSDKNSVRIQIKSAKKRGLKLFGISESQYDATDDNGLYQYKAFGIAETAFKNIDNTQVISPYSSFLALPFAKRQVEKNIQGMVDLGLYGKYGFYESHDLSKGKTMRTYMSHHQGMIICSAVNALKDGIIQKSMFSMPQIEAATMLLSHSGDIRGKKKLRLNNTRETQMKAPSLVVSERGETPIASLLGFGKYASVVSSQGKGYSAYDGILITKDGVDGGQRILATIDGKGHSLLDGVFTLNHDSCVFEKHNEDFLSKVEVFALPNQSGEARVVEFVNTSNSVLDVEFSTYTRVANNYMDADVAHPSYSDMFVTTEFDEFSNACFASRELNDKTIISAHYILAKQQIQYTTNRYNYYAKGEKRADFGQVLSPIFSGKLRSTLQPKERIAFTAFYFAGYNKAAIKSEIKLSKSEGFLFKAKGASFNLASHNNMSLSTKKLASKLLYGSAGTVKDSITDGKTRLSNRPNMTIIVKGESSLVRLRRRLTEIKKLYKHLVEFNLAIVYYERHSYFLYLSEQINAILHELAFINSLNSGSTLTLVNAVKEPKLARYFMINSISPDHEGFEQIATNVPQTKGIVYPNAALRPIDFQTKLGIGGFLSDASFAADITDINMPAPYSNIIADKEFGTLITESGGGYTFYKNSRQNKLTHWCCDAVLDSPSELVVLGEKGNLWSVTKNPIRTNSNYQFIHSFGYSLFKNNYNGILSEQKEYILRDKNTKIFDITLNNDVNVDREIDVMLALKPVLGDFIQNTAHAIDVVLEDNTLVIFNTQTQETMYVNCDNKLRSHTRFAEAFRDINGNITKNSELVDKGSELFVAVSVRVKLKANDSTQIRFSLGAEREVEFLDCDTELNSAIKYYSNLSKISAQTSQNDELPYLLKWLPYQVLCSRFFARTGFYQAGGAIGFRDQLQDCLALLYVEPKLVKEHILDCASHQFEAGDVQHWWHPVATGVRTNCSDDRLFLPLLTAEYINFTHDFSLISERVPYLENVKIKDGEHSAYTNASFTSKRESMLDHCLKAIYASFDFGTNGLVKMRGGDWNDAMDEVGANGKGTSVWLSMFLFYVIEKFLPFVNDPKVRRDFVDTLENLKAAIDKAFDGEWFVRAYTDSGIAIGSCSSVECKIDLLTQSFAVLSGACNEKKCELALNSASELLVDKNNKLVALLTPPFKDMKNIGYIAKYPKGVRENGGQYTHAAVWFVMSLVRANKYDLAWELFNMINPINHARTHNEAIHYGIEPYVLAADVYSGENGGRGGWSWYTGSAAWYYKCLVEEFYGVSFKGNTLKIEPHLPSTVEKVEFKLSTSFGRLDVEIDNTVKSGNWRIISNGINYNSQEVKLGKGFSGNKLIVKRV